jgi:hypothetical protein
MSGPIEPEAIGKRREAAARGEQRRIASAQIVFSLYRLVKALQLHADNNQAIQGLLTALKSSIDELCKLGEVEALKIVFSGQTIFVNGQIMRAARDTYAIAIELGEMLERCGVTELTIDRNIELSTLAAFGRVVSDSTRDRAAGERLRQGELRGIRARRVNLDATKETERDRTPVERAARTYAVSVVILRSQYAALSDGDYSLPQRVRRVAQKLIAQVEVDATSMVALAAAPHPDRDPASVAVSSTIIALAMAQLLSTDRLVLGNLAMAGLLSNAGRTRLEQGGLGSLRRTLNEEEEDRVAASALLTLTALGKLHPPSIARSVILYESLALQREHRLGAVYGGTRAPTVLARILHVARRFTELRLAESSSAGQIDDIIQLMTRRADGAERAYIKLLLGALGFFPMGTLVELDSGEIAVVMSAADLPIDFARPKVRVLHTRSGELLDPPLDLDLAVSVTEGVRRRIVRTVDADEAQLAAIRSAIRAAASTVEARHEPTPQPAPASARRTPTGAPLPPRSAVTQPTMARPTEATTARLAEATVVRASPLASEAADVGGSGGATREIDWAEQLARLKELRAPAPTTPAKSPVARTAADPPTVVRPALTEQDRLLAAFLKDEDEGDPRKR